MPSAGVYAARTLLTLVHGGGQETSKSPKSAFLTSATELSTRSYVQVFSSNARCVAFSLFNAKWE